MKRCQISLKTTWILALTFTLSGILFAKDPSTASATSKEVTIIPNQAQIPLLAPVLKERQTLKIRLKNGLQAYLISNPNTESSGALLGVNTGSWEDPIEYPGMAHFLEHMLFLGTEAYPDESEYDSFITEHGGNLNAFTTNAFTTYLFTVDNRAFAGALDRFSHFFIDPLFNPSGVARELNAIDQEYAKNVENDSFRLIYVLKELGDPNHPQNHFNMGNSSTLSLVSQESLKNWYHTHYSANLMRLIVVSSLPIDALEKLVINDFSQIPNYNFKPAQVDKPSTSPYASGHFIYIEPVKMTRSLVLNWELPQDLYGQEYRDSESLICHILGHEGEESLLAELKREKFADALCCGTTHLGDRIVQLTVEIGLTQEGLNEVNTVIERVFQTLSMLKNGGIPETVFEEVQRIQKIDYQYQEQQNLFENLSSVASDFMDEPLSTYPEKTKIISTYDSEAIDKVLNFLTPNHAQFIIMAPAINTSVKSDRKERWLGVPYTYVPIPSDLMVHWSKVDANPNITLPAINPFIPQQLIIYSPVALSHKETPFVLPKKIMAEDQFTLYFAQDTVYGVPQLYAYFEINTPQIDSRDIQKVVFGDLYVKALKEALLKYSYPAQMAGLNYEIETTDNGIAIALQGYSENSPLLFAEIVKLLKSVNFDEASFKNYKDTLLRQYQSFEKDSPLKQALEQFKSSVYEYYPTAREKAGGLRKLTYAKTKEMLNGIFQQNSVSAVIYGNLTEPQAQKMGQLLKQGLAGTLYPLNKQLKKEVVLLPEGKGPFYIENETKAQGNAAILAIEFSPFSFKARAAQQIVMQTMDQAFFDALRTKQQTGYLVSTSAEELELLLFNVFAVQSNTHEVRDLLARFELFIEGFLHNLKTQFMTKERFENIRASLLSQIRQTPPSLADMGKLLKRLLVNYQGDFDWKAKRIKAFEELKYEELFDFAQDFFGKKNKKRLAVLLKGVIPEDNVFDYHRIKSISEIHRISKYLSFEEQLSPGMSQEGQK